MMERNSVAAIVEYQPNDQLTVKLDALYIDFEESDVRQALKKVALYEVERTMKLRQLKMV